MRISGNYVLRNIAGENLVVRQGQQGVDMTRIISFNSSAVAIWNEFAPTDGVGREFTVDQVADFLVTTYGISKELAQKDAMAWSAKMKECGVLEDE